MMGSGLRSGSKKPYTYSRQNSIDPALAIKRETHFLQRKKFAGNISSNNSLLIKQPSDKNMGSDAGQGDLISH
jgi:hypothetical protein